MSSIIAKTDHSHICETAVFFYNNGIKGISGVSESEINVGYWRKKIFCALVREIIVALDSSELIAHANWLAADIVNSYGHYDRLIVFMNSFITDANFRNSISMDISKQNYKRAVDTLVCNCGTGKSGSIAVIGNDLAQSLAGKEPKKAEVGVILNSLMPFMLEVMKIKLFSENRSVSGKHLNTVIRDMNLTKTNGKLCNRNNCSVDYVNYTRQIEDIIMSIAAMMLTDSRIYSEILKDYAYSVENNGLSVIDGIIYLNNDINYIKCKSALHDVGLRSLVVYY